MQIFHVDSLNKRENNRPAEARFSRSIRALIGNRFFSLYSLQAVSEPNAA